MRGCGGARACACTCVRVLPRRVSRLIAIPRLPPACADPGVEGVVVDGDPIRFVRVQQVVLVAHPNCLYRFCSRQTQVVQNWLLGQQRCRLSWRLGWQRCCKQLGCVGLSLGSPCHHCRVACGVCVCACVARFGKGKVYKPRTVVVPINEPVVQARLQDLLVAMRHASR